MLGRSGRLCLEGSQYNLYDIARESAVRFVSVSNALYGFVPVQSANRSHRFVSWECVKSNERSRFLSDRVCNGSESADQRIYQRGELFRSTQEPRRGRQQTASSLLRRIRSVAKWAIQIAASHRGRKLSDQKDGGNDSLFDRKEGRKPLLSCRDRSIVVI